MAAPLPNAEARPDDASAHVASSPTHGSPTDVTVADRISAARLALGFARAFSQHGPHALAAQNLTSAIGEVIAIVELQQRALSALRAPLSVDADDVCARCGVATSSAYEIRLDHAPCCGACLLSEVLTLRAECVTKADAILQLNNARDEAEFAAVQALLCIERPQLFVLSDETLTRIRGYQSSIVEGTTATVNKHGEAEDGSPDAPAQDPTTEPKS